ncbi:GTP cyclohydrolase II [Yoonia sp. BS5-3]|uniref:GTP cyclohydrolase-2 n=1 Tax=Yoonia phaeophyticola TaxID=3137369 RepID=A0ABZ2V5L5_9RHOB
MQTNIDCLLPSMPERLARARGDLAMGLPALLTHDGARVLIVAIETLTQTRLDALRDMFGAPELLLTAKRGQAIMAPATAALISDDTVRVCPPADATLEWFQKQADTQFDAARAPTGPLHLVRNAATALHEAAIKLVKKAELLPAVGLFTLPADMADNPLHLVPITAQDALHHLALAPVLAPVAAARLPLETHDVGRLHVFRDPDGMSEHYAIEIGKPDPDQPVLSRLHSACFTGDVLGSLKCDCGPQLDAALARMGEEGAGVLLYLNQEGRGIGLANKMRVYDLQSKGLDTVEANHRLGYEDDERDFRIAAVMLSKLGFQSVRLLTNNPAKVQTFHDNGITITEQLPLRVGRNIHNQNYLSVKALKSGHML